MKVEGQNPGGADQQVVCGLPVEASVLFSDKKGVYKHRIEKARTRLLKKLGFLGPFLAAEEKILLVTTGCSPFSVLEELSMGVWVASIKQAMFVFTNKRLLHVPVTLRQKYRGSVAQILYEDCESLKIKGSTLVVKYHSGRKERFHYIAGRDRATIKQFTIESNTSDRPSENPQRNHLCPNCTAMLGPLPLVPACPACGLEFKDKAKARMYSLLLPGGGYFYVNRPLMGVIDALVETYLSIALVWAFVAALRGEPDTWPVAMTIGMVLAIEKLTTIYHSNSFLAEFIPNDVKSLLQGQPHVAVSPTPAPKPEPAEAPKVEPGPEDILSVR